MGCTQSVDQEPASDIPYTTDKFSGYGNGYGDNYGNGYANAQDPSYWQRMHRLVRPERYPTGHHRPSFYSTYARAAKRYGFETGRYAGFAFRNGIVCKVRGEHDKDTDHEVPADAIQNGDSEYVVPVRIGTPGVVLNLDFDTGSSDLWIWSTELANAAKYTASHAIYDPTNSSTSCRHHSKWRISYGDGSSASGDVYTDVVTVAGVTIPDQAIELARDLSDSFLADGGNDGLLGLAWPSINTVQPNPVKTPVQNMMEQGLITQPIFTVKLTRGDEPGFYSFGYIDPNVTRYPFCYTPVDNSQGFWQVTSRYYSINGQTFERHHHHNSAILDTGTTLCLVDDHVVHTIYESIDGAVYDDQQGGWKYPEDAVIPQVAFAVGEELFIIHPSDFGYGHAHHGYIFGGIQSRGDSSFDILGDVFLKSVYVVFNQGEQTVGVAQRED